MISDEDALASVVQTMLRVRYPQGPVGREEIAAVVDECGALLPDGLNADARTRIIAELETRVVIKVGRPTKIVDERGHVPWYIGDRKTDRRFFRRYIEFLRQDQGWPQASIDAIDEFDGRPDGGAGGPRAGRSPGTDAALSSATSSPGRQPTMPDLQQGSRCRV